ncbi:unnamed protein product [Urochloa humidicola]
MVLDLNLPPDEGDGEGVPDVPEDDEDRGEMHHVQGDDQIAVEGHGIGNQGLHPLDGIPVEEEIHPGYSFLLTILDIRLLSQPPNSPDLNCLDLGFFASLQSLAANRISRNLDELIANVQKEYDDYDPKLIRNVFLTLQGCMIEVMKDGGGNKYKVPHMSKDKLEAQGILPNRLSCERELYENVMQILGNQ